MSVLNKLNSVSLSKRVIASTMLIVIGVVGANYVVFTKGYRSSSEKQFIKEAQVFTALADETKNHVSRLNGVGAFDATLLQDLVKKRHDDPNYDYTKHPVFGSIPVVAGWIAAGEAAEKEGLDFKTPAFEARNPDNEPSADPDSKSREFRTAMLRRLADQVRASDNDEVFAINEQTNTLHYMRAIRLDASCMVCHGDPKTSTTGDGKDPLGFAMENWKVGDMHGAFEVAMPLAPLDEQVAGFIGSGLMFTGPLVAGSGLVLIFLLRAWLTKPVTKLIDMVKDVATGDGDLTKRIGLERGDEIGKLAHWFDVFLDNQHKLIKEVSLTTTEVAGAATEIAASSEQLSAGMQQQQRQSAQVSAAVEEMAASIKEVAEKASSASEKSSEAGARARTGGEVVGQTVTGMNAISEEVAQSAAAVGELGRRGEQIGQIISVINDIADQTNLLALNAAIEAARAGEHGRGFAVVADEVRKLAERTQKATEEVSESIRAIQQETTRAVERMETGRQRVDSGVALAREAGDALAEIVAGSQDVAAMIQSIAAATEQQSAASGEVAKNVEAINAVTLESAEGVRQASSAATQLSTKAEQLQALVGRFRL